MNTELSSHLPVDILEQRAAQQRQRIHDSVGEFKSSVRENVRERLDVRNYLRDSGRLWRFAGVASLVALVAGYGMAGMFSRR